MCSEVNFVILFFIPARAGTNVQIHGSWKCAIRTSTHSVLKSDEYKCVCVRRAVANKLLWIRPYACKPGNVVKFYRKSVSPAPGPDRPDRHPAATPKT